MSNRLGLLAGALLGIWVSSGAPSAAQTVPLEVNDGGYLFVRMRVADVDARLMLDTGAGINTLSSEMLGRLGSNARRAGNHTGTRHNGERLTVDMWAVSSMTLGPVVQQNAVVGGFAPAGADGLLSMDFFRDRPFTLDFAKGELTFETPARLNEIAAKARQIPIRPKLNGPNELSLFVSVCVGDVAADAEFDTGSGFNMLMLNPSYMERLGIRPGGTPRGPLEYYVHTTTLPEMHYCEAPSVGSTQQFVGFKDGLIYEGLVGHGAFRDRRLTIDIPGRRMLVW